MERELDKKIYSVGLWLSVPIIAGIIVFMLVPDTGFPHLPCMAVLVFRLYCPGCGGTRAVRALSHGKFLESLFFHPIVLYSTVVYVLYMARNTLYRKGIGKGMQFRTAYIWIGLVIIILNVIVKNVLWRVFDLPMEQMASHLFH